ncbi:MAG: mannitol dehydrogenase family protein [Sphingomonadales bacterium]|nr:mannitol dehydrogenase family protein [Sphingomonadales bacterium]
MERFAYDRAAQAVGIVHFGIGAFHRAHQAWYTDRAMDGGDRDWAITGVSLRSPAVAELMNPQDGLYSVVENSEAAPTYRVVGAIREVMVAQQNRAGLATALIAPATKIVSFTVTEKGYCRAPDGSLDFALAGEHSVYPILADALRQRRAAGIAGLTLLSCDNLADNGGQLGRLMGEYLDRHDPVLRAWFERECACPATMVDRIVPATTPSDLDRVESALGLRDEAAVLTEPFSQWVIEDRFAAGRPAWDRVGAELVQDVAPYETAKLRMLNGAHSALAYLGLGRGHAFAHETIVDPAIRPLIEWLIRREAMPSLTPAPGQNLAAYADALLARFANSALGHRLAQIAMDGSQKLPQRWLETLAWHADRGGQCPAILTALAAWLRHVRGDNGPVDDPWASRLAELWAAAGVSGITQAVFGEAGPLASAWRPSPADVAFVAGRLTI